jgi:hypothetical protein
MIVDHRTYTVRPGTLQKPVETGVRRNGRMSWEKSGADSPRRFDHFRAWWLASGDRDRSAFRHRQEDRLSPGIRGADREVKRGTLSLTCSPNFEADRSKNSYASRPARTRRYAPCPTVGNRVWPLMEGTRQSSSDSRSDAKSAV